MAQAFWFIQDCSNFFKEVSLVVVFALERAKMDRLFICTYMLTTCLLLSKIKGRFKRWKLTFWDGLKSYKEDSCCGDL